MMWVVEECEQNFARVSPYGSGGQLGATVGAGVGAGVGSEVAGGAVGASVGPGVGLQVTLQQLAEQNIAASSWTYGSAAQHESAHGSTTLASAAGTESFAHRAVGAAVGSGVGAVLGNKVGDGVGIPVGREVGAGVGADVGAQVRPQHADGQLRRTLAPQTGLQHWSVEHVSNISALHDGAAVGEDVVGGVGLRLGLGVGRAVGTEEVGAEVVGETVDTVGEAVGAQLSSRPQHVAGQKSASCGRVQHSSVGAVAAAVLERVKSWAQTTRLMSASQPVGPSVGAPVGAVGAIVGAWLQGRPQCCGQMARTLGYVQSKMSTPSTWSWHQSGSTTPKQLMGAVVGAS